ncbi:MFS transporter [Bombiscardovia nodaiensis]|uniref:MFS transporter n=1 Tax=Bombiscardovia nodaiensis TaxID=2932181 RepID=A0ABN6SDM6_9BIFI|nr:MFS transporter [Bombiscardovia nodaiensis]
MNQPTKFDQRSILTPLFLSLLITEVLSSLGQVILTFALPLHLLNLTGSASLYGLVTALALIPSVLLTPLGGGLADRLNKRTSMAVLDFSTAVLAALYLLLSRKLDLVVLTIAVMMDVYGLHALYSPVVQAAVPFIIDASGEHGNERLTRATALITQVTSLTIMLGPVLAGMLLGFAGIGPVVLLAGLACLLSSIWIALALPIPRRPAAESSRGLLKNLLADFAQAAHFLLARYQLIVVNLLVTLANFVFAAFANVALPYVVTQLLGLSNQLQGLAEGLISAGGLAGAVLVAVRPAWFTLERVRALLAACGLCLLPIALSLFFAAPPMVSYLVLLASLAVAVGLIQCVSVTFIAYEQTETPKDLVGKVIGLTMCLAMAAMPLGQALYGPIIDHLPMPAIMLAVALIMVTASLLARRSMRAHS